MSKNFDETVRLQLEKREEWIREIRGERLQGIAEGTSSAPRLASSSAAWFPGRSDSSGTHCNLTEQVHRSHPCQNEKKQSHLSRSPDRMVGESQGEREPHIGEREGDLSGSTERKGWTP